MKILLSPGSGARISSSWISDAGVRRPSSGKCSDKIINRSDGQKCLYYTGNANRGTESARGVL